VIARNEVLISEALAQRGENLDASAPLPGASKAP
jgi:hypothetical protein